MLKSSPRGSASAPSAEAVYGPTFLAKNFAHLSHTCIVTALCVTLCTNHPNSGATTRPQCTAVIHPQSPNMDHTAVDTVIHSPVGPLAAVRPSRPQIAHPLLLLLRSLRRFFFEVHAWGHLVRTGRQPVANPVRRRRRLAFKLALEALRLVFDSRCGRRGEALATGVRHGQSPQCWRGSRPIDLNSLFR